VPRRRRTSKRRDELTLGRMLALTAGPDLRGGESDNVLAGVYELHRDRLLADCPPGTRPWAFWAFEPGVPADLRAERPVLRRDEGDGDGDHGHHRRVEADLDRRRGDFLQENTTRPVTGHDPHLGGAR